MELKTSKRYKTNFIRKMFILDSEGMPGASDKLRDEGFEESLCRKFDEVARWSICIEAIKKNYLYYYITACPDTRLEYHRYIPPVKVLFRKEITHYKRRGWVDAHCLITPCEKSNLNYSVHTFSMSFPDKYNLMSFALRMYAEQGVYSFDNIQNFSYSD